MILESKTDTLILEEGEVQGSTNMEIDQDSHMFLMRMLSKFYSDGIGSSIRETCSNALDSHRECGSHEPIIVSLKSTATGNYEFSVQDFGCGIDDQDVENIIKKYGKSTKRASANQLGAFGLGFKSPLAYTSSFYFIGRKGGIERKWMLYESDDESNKIDLLYEGPTTERNGVKVIVPVKYGDRHTFTEKIAEQLAYFENVYFDCGYDFDNNTIKIVRSEHFQWSSLVKTSVMHICLDNVYYPIDFSKLGISPINFPVGLRFTLSDNIFPVPNREQLKYTNEAKKAILDKISLVAEYFVNKYNENIKDSDDIFAIIKHYQNTERYVSHVSGNGSMNVRNLVHYSSVKFQDPKLNGVKYLTMNRLVNIRDTFLYPYNAKYTYSNGRFNGIKTGNAWRYKLYFRELEDTRETLYTFTEMNMLKKVYIKEQLGNKYAKFIRKENQITLGKKSKRYSGSGLDTYMSILELWNYPRSEWRDRIKEYQELATRIEARFIDADKIIIPKAWFEARKKQRLKAMAANGTNKRRQKLSGEITGKVAHPLERYVSGKNCKLVSTPIQMAEASKQKFFTIYGGTDNESLIQELFPITKSSNIRLVIFSDRELKNLEKVDLHNWMKLTTFMEGKHIKYRRIVTAYLISKLIEKHVSVFNKLNLIEGVSKNIHLKLSRLLSYKREYHNEGNDSTLEAMVEVAEANKLFDPSIYDVYKEMSFVLNKLTFLNPLLNCISPYYGDEAALESIIRDLFKYYKQRIDWEHYKLPIEDKVEEKQIEEEII